MHCSFDHLPTAYAFRKTGYANAVPTAQAAVRILLEALPVMLADAELLVVGYGRIGKVLTGLLRAMGARVCVASRGVERTIFSVPTGDYGESLLHCDAIINTAPAPVLGYDELVQTRPDCFLLDLASAPGGIDRQAAEQLGRRLRWELSLPGREFPTSAGRVIEQTVLRHLRTVR